MKIAICAHPGSGEVSRRISNNLRKKGHKTIVTTSGLKSYMKAIGDSDALLVAEEGDVSLELGVAIIFADYLRKGIMAKSRPSNKELQTLLNKVDVKIIG